MSKGKIFVISGASGVGKSTVLKEVLASRDDLYFSVSATTRAPRPDEVDGVNYSFITKEAFQAMIDEDAFVEYDNHMKSWYGTPRAQMEEKLAKGCAVLDVEPNGAFTVRKERPDAVLTFIAPPSMEELERRLRGRNDTTEDQIQDRLKRAVWEMTQRHKYDYIVINDQVETCAEEILKIIADHCGE